MFFISYGATGKKTYFEKEGLAADFCPICRQAEVVEVFEIRSQTHVYRIGIGEGDLVGRLCACVTCHSRWLLKPNTIQTLVNPVGPVSVPGLLAETYPRFAAVNGTRLEIETVVQRDPHSLDARTRSALIAEPFAVLAEEIDRLSGSLFGPAYLFAGNLFLLAVLIAMVAFGFFVGESPWVGSALVVVAIALGVVGALLSQTAESKIMRDGIYPRLASCLAPLDPSGPEIAMARSQIDSKCARLTKLDDFMPVLAEARAARRLSQSVSQPVER